MQPSHRQPIYSRRVLLRKLGGRFKRTVQRTFTIKYENLRRSLSVLQSNYPELVWDASLEHAFSLQIMPTMVTLHEDDRWKWLEVGGFRFCWPRSYSCAGLPWVFQEVFSPSDRNPHSYEYKKVRLEPGNWVLDGGACEGFFVRYALQRGCSVIAVEPVPVVAEALERTFEYEISMGRVRIINAALGERTGFCTITVPNLDPTMAEIIPGTEGTTPLITIDELIKLQGINKLDFIKLDIEGAEIAAIHGASDTLRLHQPAVSIAVYHEHSNALRLKQFIQTTEPAYSLRYRGVWLRPGDIPRPYMLLGVVR